MTKGYEIKSQGKEAEILIFEEIGAGFFGGISAKQFAEDLKALGDVDLINVRINSPGGQVFDAHAIFNTLLRHKARVEVDIDGMALSAAAVVAMAGDEVRMAENAMFMIHDPWILTMGSAPELREVADTLDKIRSTIVASFAGRRGLDAEHVSELMAAETWMTAQEALDEGFIDSMTESQRVAAHFDPARFPYMKKELIGLASGDEEAEPTETPHLTEAREKVVKIDFAARKIRSAREQSSAGQQGGDG